MGGLLSFLDINGIVYTEKCLHTADCEFHWLLFVCGLWIYAGNLLAHNYFECFYIRSECFLFNQPFSQ